ncbi:hypothetical protein MNEG_16614 [Monoraphidium neglectum]|uniref:Uncharacterized protein n=1 Tax=Monoraphidium neglectum TaxID=145388 RepID=A0A0D2M790_9CHLO|nr:hypothetical protein MNEG_16614 [Monoraphidium neglectum]KIY91350.1 hypothetical protein MNEG_16614 [Monoraphidium neglectum]|eukprot:XP_013890370.1 hypothetical protein MNEG_16614 [Monoraphidium neglectum]
MRVELDCASHMVKKPWAWGTFASQRRKWEAHATLSEDFRHDHIAPNKEVPVALLANDPEYAAAKKLAESEAQPDKGERPDDLDRQRHW